MQMTMNNLLNHIFYCFWRLLNPARYLSYLRSKKIKINLSRKVSYTGFLPKLEDISKKVSAELEGNYTFLTRVKEAKKSTEEGGFVFDCAAYLSASTKDEILNIAQENYSIVNLAQNFLGIKPHLNTISIYVNVPRIGDKEVGSKSWHRDGNTFLTADFMFAITKINDDNGPFFYIDPIDFGSNKSFKPKVNLGWESGGRFSTEEFTVNGLNPHLIKKFTGKPGTYIMLNTGEAFHKGGYCESEIRILGRFVYSSFGYSNGNLNKYGLLKSKPLKIRFKLIHALYSLHEKIYRNLLNRI